jgi:two-component system LytT family sensor kinase
MLKSFNTVIDEKISTRGRWAYLRTMPPFVIVFSYLLIGSSYFKDLSIFAAATSLNLAILTGIYLTQNHVMELITRRYAGFHQTFRRVAFSLLSHAVISGTFLLVIAFLYVRFGLFGSTVTYKALIIIYGVNLAAIILVTTIQETFHSLGNWRSNEINKEKLRKENIRGQLQSLKAQISPHFLFNSLNSLSTLIAENPSKAEQFVDQMARVYRYLLHVNQNNDASEDSYELTTLENELIFIESYYHLLKTRHGEGLHLRIDIDQDCIKRRLPPLTLQLLVENAVKHNVIKVSSPLFIEIMTTDDGLLRVSNNLQKKMAPGIEKMESTRLGLVNILAKYNLLEELQQNLPKPSIENGPENFVVTIPLISQDTTVI